ncbi:hypothetical protein HK405_000217 [Cladochytrium tenue]|nr:hypothetical protein HK405_000217 [Cladochytrium tenue]
MGRSSSASATDAVAAAVAPAPSFASRKARAAWRPHRSPPKVRAAVLAPQQRAQRAKLARAPAPAATTHRRRSAGTQTVPDELRRLSAAAAHQRRLDRAAAAATVLAAAVEARAAQLPLPATPPPPVAATLTNTAPAPAPTAHLSFVRLPRAERHARSVARRASLGDKTEAETDARVENGILSSAFAYMRGRSQELLLMEAAAVFFFAALFVDALFKAYSATMPPLSN